MNKPVEVPDRLQPAACPLLAAVLPLRYAIGPVDPRHPTSLDAEALGLPGLHGDLPYLGPDHPQHQNTPLGYVPRMLRDGYIYLWDETLQELSEYKVESSLLTLSDRGAGLKGQGASAYLLLEAGAPVRMTWSPCCWSDDIFAQIEQEPELRQRLMRKLIPGRPPFSGQVKSLHPEIGDIKPENFRWSCAPEPAYWLLEEPPLQRMRRCEQQHFALVDDPWGVLMDVAGLMRSRTLAFDKLSAYRDDWSIVAIVQSMRDSDEKIRSQIASSIDESRLQEILRDQERETSAIEADRLRLVDIWAAWFDTLGGSTPSSLASACEHFDIRLPDARDMLEVSFAASCLGPAATSPGVKAIERALDLEQVKGQPWLFWALMGVTERLDTGHLQRILSIPDALPAVTGDVGDAAARLARVSALVLALNQGADNLAKQSLVGGGDPLFAVVSTVVGGRLATLPEQMNQHTYGLMISMLARSKQRLEAGKLAPADAMRWLSEQIGTAHNKTQERNLESERDKLERQQSRSGEPSTSGVPAKSPMAVAVNRGVPFLRVVPAPSSPAHANNPQPGSKSPNSASRPAPTSTPALPTLSGKAASVEMPRSIRDLINEAPLKTLIALVSVWNLKESGQSIYQDSSPKNFVAGGSAFWTTAAASTAVLQQLAEIKWERHAAQVGHLSPVAQESLARALGAGAAAMLFQAIAAGLDVFYFGWRALDAYRAGDLDTAGIHVGLSGTNMALAGASVKAIRALRVARAAVLAGEAEALVTGLRVLTLPLRLTLIGLAITILVGLVGLLFTEDEPLEQWLKQTCIGTRPASWASSLQHTLQKLYQIVLPVSLKLERWNDINPRNGQLVEELCVVLHLPGQSEYRQGMVSFEGREEWLYNAGLFGFNGTENCIRLAWDEEERLPLWPEVGGRVQPKVNGIRLVSARHETHSTRLIAIRGSLIYQPIEGLYLPPIDIDVS